MDAGRAYPPMGAGRAPKVPSVAATHGNGVTIDNGQGATLTMEGSSVDINDGALKVS